MPPFFQSSCPPPRAKRAAFTLIELLVVMGIIVMLASFLFPAIKKAIGTARKTRCGVNLTNIYKAYAIRKNDEIEERDFSLDTSNWATTLAPYLNDHRETFLCPLDRDPHSGGGAPTIRCSYGMNDNDNTRLLHTEKILFMDFNNRTIQAAGMNPPPWTALEDIGRHRKRCNVVMANGSLREMYPSSIDPSNPSVQTNLWVPAGLPPP